jgi:hypothetical protein
MKERGQRQNQVHAERVLFESMQRQGPDAVVYIRGNLFRYLAICLAGPLCILVLLAPFVSGDALLMIFSALGIPLIFIDLFASRHAGEMEFLHSDRLDICIDAGTICGPVKNGVFGLAQPEVVPLDAIDLSCSRYNYVFGSYLALNDGRILVVSTLAHPARNVRRVFEEVRKRTGTMTLD